MNFYVNQSICIQNLRINALTNSSVLQIGSVGILRPNSNLFNTGGFTEAAPDTKQGILQSVSPQTSMPSIQPAQPSVTLTPPGAD